MEGFDVVGVLDERVIHLGDFFAGGLFTLCLIELLEFSQLLLEYGIGGFPQRLEDRPELRRLPADAAPKAVAQVVAANDLGFEHVDDGSDRVEARPTVGVVILGIRWIAHNVALGDVDEDVVVVLQGSSGEAVLVEDALIVVQRREGDDVVAILEEGVGPTAADVEVWNACGFGLRPGPRAGQRFRRLVEVPPEMRREL